MKDVISKFHESKKDDSILTAANLLRSVINMHLLEDGNGRICCLILTHVLMQMNCNLFPVHLTSFHRRGRRHYIRTVKLFDRKLSAVHDDCKVLDTLLG